MEPAQASRTFCGRAAGQRNQTAGDVGGGRDLTEGKPVTDAHLEENVHRVLRPDGTSAEHGEAGLHQENQVGGHKHVRSVERPIGLAHSGVEAIEREGLLCHLCCGLPAAHVGMFVGMRNTCLQKATTATTKRVSRCRTKLAERVRFRASNPRKAQKNLPDVLLAPKI